MAESIDEASMKNKELITELSVKLGWTSKEVTEMLAAFGAVVGSKLADNDAVYLC
nr:HU family DNA-binding protein [Parabacteroides goldsteinii]